ncbi:cathepsin D-like [Periplaneta americana]|uniref:cathepsin D-like n=1 Tax=Periplaneta americana TaxID=6978 RepID=UPI0037E7A773
MQGLLHFQPGEYRARMSACGLCLTLILALGATEGLIRVPLTRVQKGQSLQARDGTNVALTNVNNIMYLAEILVGAQQQPFKVQVDTGSSNLFIPSPNSDSCGTFNNFQCQNYVSNEDITLKYGSNAVQGPECEDTVTIGGIPVQNQYFTVVDSCNASLQGGLEGIMGVGFSSTAENFVSLYGETVQPAPVLVNIFNQQPDQEQVFSLYLSNDDSQGQSELTIGGIDPKHYTGNLVFADLVPNSFSLVQQWQVNIQGFSVGGKDVGECGISSCTVVIDSGTSLITIPYQEYDALIYALQTMEPGVTVQRQPQGGFLATYVIYTQDISNLQPIVVTIQGQQFVINPADYTTQINEGIYLVEVSMNENPQNENQQLWILGDTFMRTVYAVFDMDNKRIGFATPN